MKKNIRVYDAGKLRGSVSIEDSITSECPIELIKVKVEDEEIDVIHLLDMDYGIVIPKHVCEKIIETMG